MHRSLIPFCHTGLSNCRATVQSFSLASCVALTPCRMECAINATCADRGTWPPPHQSCRQLPLVEPRRYGRQRRRRPATHAGSDEGPSLATEFQSFLNEHGVPELLRNRQPTHLLSPLACIAAQMDALQRNDWPEMDAGVQTAFAFAKWEGADELLSAQAGPRRVRSWAAREEWLALPDFSNCLHTPPYSALLNCDSWQPASPLVFPSERHRNKAVCAVAATAGGRQHVFTFCLERVPQGPLKNCWLTVGVREGDYASC